MTTETTAFITPEGLRQLRADTRMGSGNFLDRCYQVNPARTAHFIHLDRPFVLPDGRIHTSLSLESLMQARETLAKWYVQHGVRSGQTIALSVADGIGPFVHYLALTSLEAAAGIINPHMRPEVARAYIAAYPFSQLVIDQQVARSFPANLDIYRTVLDGRDPAYDPNTTLPAGWPLEPQDSTLVMISHTSGTTGIPKAVRFEHRQFFMGKRARLGQFATSSSERVLSALPQSHSSAISHLETVVSQGITTMVLADPLGPAVVRAVEHFRPTTVLGFPQTYASLAREPLARANLSSVRRWFSMGDAAHATHVRRVLEASPDSQFIDAFGSSELGMALFTKSMRLHETLAPRCVGRPAEIAVAKVLDPDTGQELPAGKVGLLGVRSPTITSGYWEAPERTAKAWLNGYFLTGDVGFTERGDFHLIDRAVDVIRVDGRELYSLLLEELVQTSTSVADASVVALGDNKAPDGLFALLLLDPGGDESPAETCEQAFALLRADSPPRIPICVAATRTSAMFPVGPTGKVLRPELRRLGSEMQRALRNGQCLSDIEAATDGSHRMDRAELGSPRLQAPKKGDAR